VSEQTAAGRATYDVRPFRPSDREAYLDLYGEVFGSRPTDAWFDWKYASNPYADGVPIVVAVHEGNLVGARSFLALELRTPTGRVGAFQACDTMVDPGHRRQGLFTRMTRDALTRYADGPALSFNFPNERTLSGNRKLGWELVEHLPVHHRFQDPARLVDRLPSALRRPLAAGVSGCYRLGERLRAPTAPGVAVERRPTVPVELLADLTRRRPPDAFHVPRDERFYGWRYARPDRDYDTYVARRDGRPVGATVVGSGPADARFMEFLPRTGREDGVSAALVRAALADHADAPLVSAVADDVDPELLAAFGFLGGDAPLVGRLVGTRPFVVRPFGDEPRGWRLDGADVRDPDNWLVGFGELDVG
jgi:hypothetical protein